MSEERSRKKPGVQKPARSYRAIAIAVVAIIAAGGLGYLAWTLREERNTARGQLAESRRSADTCTQKLTTHGATIAKLSQERDTCVAAREGDAAKYQSIEANLSTMQKNLRASREELENLRKQREEAEKRLRAFKELTAKLKAMIDTGTIDVVVRKGRMLVELPAAVLFASGSAELSEPGKKALMEVGVILKKIPDRRFMVAGHTDNVPLRSSKYRNNWELSTARAVTVTEFLIYVGMKPQNLVAAGHGAHDPVASNKTKEGKRKNRRIEIILLPNLDELPPLPEDIEVADEEEP